MRHEKIPFGEGELGVTGGKTGAEVVFPSLDGAFCCIATVAMGGHALEIDVVFLEGLFELVGTFVVEDVEARGVAVGLEACVQCGPGVCEFAGLTCFDWFGENGVAIEIIKDHDGGVASRGLDWESAGLVRVGFLEQGGEENGGKNDMGACVLGFLRGAKVEGGGEWQVGGDGFGGSDVFLLHTEMAFAGGEGLGKVLCDQRGGETRPGVEMATLDCPEKCGREGTESASMQVVR